MLAFALGPLLAVGWALPSQPRSVALAAREPLPATSWQCSAPFGATTRISSSARAHVLLAEHVVQKVIAPRAGVLLRSWQKQAEDNWSQGFTPTSTMDGMRRLSAQVKQLQRMAALAYLMTVRSPNDTEPMALKPFESHFSPYLSRLPHMLIFAAIAPGNGTALAFSATMDNRAELLHLEASPICNDEHARNAQAALLDAFIARAAEALPATGTVTADAVPGTIVAELLAERGFAEENGVEGWMPDFVRFTRAVGSSP